MPRVPAGHLAPQVDHPASAEARTGAADRRHGILWPQGHGPERHQTGWIGGVAVIRQHHPGAGEPPDPSVGEPEPDASGPSHRVGSRRRQRRDLLGAYRRRAGPVTHRHGAPGERQANRIRVEPAVRRLVEAPPEHHVAERGIDAGPHHLVAAGVGQGLLGAGGAGVLEGAHPEPGQGHGQRGRGRPGAPQPGGQHHPEDQGQGDHRVDDGDDVPGDAQVGEGPEKLRAVAGAGVEGSVSRPARQRGGVDRPGLGSPLAAQQERRRGRATGDSALVTGAPFRTRRPLQVSSSRGCDAGERSR